MKQQLYEKLQTKLREYHADGRPLDEYIKMACYKASVTVPLPPWLEVVEVRPAWVEWADGLLTAKGLRAVRRLGVQGDTVVELEHGVEIVRYAHGEIEAAKTLWVRPDTPAWDDVIEKAREALSGAGDDHGGGE